MEKNSSNDPWHIHYAAIKIYENAILQVRETGEREDIATIWKVQMPDYSLRNLMGSTYFGRRRWFASNPYALTADTRELLRPITPGYIEKEWEKWKEPQPWLSLLALWTPQWLEKQLGQPLASLQLLVDLADHVRTRQLLPLDEKSRTTTALLISAESLLKWPTHYLTLLSRERGHPLSEVRSVAVSLWEQEKIRLDYLTRCATNLLPTRKLAQELHAELLQQLTLLQSNQQMTLRITTSANESQQRKKPRWMQETPEANAPVGTQVTPPAEKREKSAHEQLLVKMAIRCKEDRH
jgi:hypothetical protein